jgi:hypothetical protein
MARYKAQIIIGVLVGSMFVNSLVFWGGWRFRYPCEPLIAVVAGMMFGKGKCKTKEVKRWK